MADRLKLTHENIWRYPVGSVLPFSSFNAPQGVDVHYADVYIPGPYADSPNTEWRKKMIALHRKGETVEFPVWERVA